MADIRLHGADPSKERREQKAVPTLSAFFEEYLVYIKARKRSWRGDENRMRQRLLPAFGDQPLNTITRKQLVDFHLALKDEGLAGATCDHFPKLLRAMYNVAMQWGVVKENPAAKIPLFNEWNQIENYLTEEQLRKLLSVLQSHVNSAWLAKWLCC